MRHFKLARSQISRGSPEAQSVLASIVEQLAEDLKFSVFKEGLVAALMLRVAIPVIRYLRSHPGTTRSELFADKVLDVFQGSLKRHAPAPDCRVHGVAYVDTTPMHIILEINQDQERKELALVHELLHVAEKLQGVSPDHQQLHMFAAALLSAMETMIGKP